MNRLTIILALGLTTGLLIGCGEAEVAEGAEATEPSENSAQPMTGINEEGLSATAMDAPGGVGGRGFRARSGPVILGREDVQGELGLSEEQIGHLDEILGSDDEPAQIEEHLVDVLDDDQIARYPQINLQREGAGALVKEEIAAEIGLSDDQVSAIEEAIEAGRPQRGESGFEREAITKLREEMDAKIDEILTDAQKAKWEEMLGEPFEFARRQGSGAASQATRR